MIHFKKMVSRMERKIEKSLKKILKKERFQGRMINYMSKVGKLLLFVLPIALLIITLLAFIQALDFTLRESPSQIFVA
jgi:uncharacterized membrane protein